MSSSVLVGGRLVGTRQRDTTGVVEPRYKLINEHDDPSGGFLWLREKTGAAWALPQWLSVAAPLNEQRPLLVYVCNQ
jgi:cation transport regulator ChaC